MTFQSILRCKAIAAIFLIATSSTMMAESTVSIAPLSAKDLGDLFKSSGEAIQKLGDAVAHIVGLSTSGYDAVAARRHQSRIRDIYTRLVSANRGFNNAVVSSLDDYISAYDCFEKRLLKLASGSDIE